MTDIYVILPTVISLFLFVSGATFIYWLLNKIYLFKFIKINASIYFGFVFFISVVILLGQFFNAYRPKNSLNKIDSSSFFTKPEIREIISEKPRVKSLEERLDFLELQRLKKSEELQNE